LEAKDVAAALELTDEPCAQGVGLTDRDGYAGGRLGGSAEHLRRASRRSHSAVAQHVRLAPVLHEFR